MRELRASGAVSFIAGQPEAIVDDGGGLAALSVLCSDGTTRTVPLDALFVLLGWSPKLGPIADWGLALERKQIVVNTASFETSTPGIFAVGDVTHPGKQKLIVCGFHRRRSLRSRSASASGPIARSRCSTRQSTSFTSCSGCAAAAIIGPRCDLMAATHSLGVLERAGRGSAASTETVPLNLTG
jgi:hypothetical protein